MHKLLVFVVCFIALSFTEGLRPKMIPNSEITKTTAIAEKAPLKMSRIYTGITNYPPWQDGRNAPWSSNVRVPDIYDRNDRLLSTAVDALGRIYVCYETIWRATGAGSPNYGWGLATSADNGLTWDNRVFYVNSTTMTLRYPEVAITTNGNIWIWGSGITTSGASTYQNDVFWMQSTPGWFNNPDSLDGFYWFGGTIDSLIYPEVITYGDNTQLIMSTWTYTTSEKVIEWIYATDGGGASYSIMTLSANGYSDSLSTVGVNYDGTNYIAVHGWEEHNGIADWTVNCMFDTLDTGTGLYGWSTSNANPDHFPSVFCSQGYAYIGYQSDVASGNYDIMFNYSTDYGQTWLGTMLDLTNDAATETYPRLNGTGSTIGLDYLYAGNRVRFNYSLDFGQEGTWLNTPEVVTDTNLATALYHSAALLYTPTYWHAAWEDTRIGASDIEVYASRRVMGQGNITHRPGTLIFDYDFKAGVFAEKYVIYSQAGVDKKLEGILGQSRSDEKIPVFVMMAKQMNPDYLIGNAEQMSKSERRRFVIDECQNLANESQHGILDHLSTRTQDGSAEDVESLWSTNTVALKATPAVIRELAQRSDVWEIGYAEQAGIIDGTNGSAPAYKEVKFNSEDGREICWGVAKINADDVWPLGYTGSGVVVGHMDTGVNYNHTDLADHLWDGGVSYPNHGYDFVNNDLDPMDDDDHGTATAGIVAGDGTSGSNTGVAPDARIMILKCDGTNIDMQEAIQFGITNNVDLFGTSLGFENPGTSIKDWSRGQSNAIYAYGVVFCVAAGNGNSVSGGHYPVPQDINSPADCPGPYYAPNGGNGAVMAVGATTASDVVDTYSSYGPTAWGTLVHTDYPYPPGLIKPDVAAPGSNCKSLSRTVNNGYTINWYGTSFAQPHLAGTVALMLSRNPALTPRQIDSLIQTTALDIGTAGRDNYSGAGRIDALLAVNSISAGSKWAKLWVINQATATGILQVTNITKQLNQSWLISYTPAAFSIPINDSEAVMVSVDTTGKGLTWGVTYHDTLLVWSNSVADDNPEKVPIILAMGTIGVEENKPVDVGHGLTDLFIQPNPFRNSISIEFTVLNGQRVNLAVYDVTGRKVRTLADQSYKPGKFSLAWDGSDDKGSVLSSGVYFCRLETEDNQITNKLILTR